MVLSRLSHIHDGVWGQRRREGLLEPRFEWIDK